MSRRKRVFSLAAVLVLLAGGTAVLSAAAVSPGDLPGWMRAHCQSVADQIAASSNPSDQAALQADLDATAGYLGKPCPTTTIPTTTTTEPPTTTSTSVPATTTSSIVTTTSSVPSTTTTTVAPTTLPPTTTTTTAPTTTTTVGNVPACGLQLETAPMAFCETFSSTAGADPASRAGDLNAQLWGVSRLSSFVNQGQQQFNKWYTSTMVGCGSNQTVMAPRDVRICNGRLIEAASDHEGQTVLAMYPKQPFDVLGRTGTVGFDVSADSSNAHAAWPEFWWTDQPTPAPSGGQIPVQDAAPRNGLGVSFAGQCGSNGITVDVMFASRNHQTSTLPFSGSGCVSKGSVTGGLNHVEIRVSQTQVQVFMTNPGSTSLVLMATANNANLTLSRGVVWLNDVHYNGCKFGASQCDHAFAWDNLGFDGPKPYRDLSFDAPDASQANNGNLGKLVGSSPVGFSTVPVYQLQTPTSILAMFNAIGFWPVTGEVPQVRVNGGPWHTATGRTGSDSWHTYAIPIPASEVNTGNVSNLVEFRTAGGSSQVVSNVNLVLIAGAPVP